MPRKKYHEELYGDALMALAAATNRPATIVDHGDNYAIRVDFELSRHLIATNAVGGLDDDRLESALWVVRLLRESDGGVHEVASSTDPWLVDAYDRAVAAVTAEEDRNGFDPRITVAPLALRDVPQAPPAEGGEADRLGPTA
ncbi:hypothetical protein DW322_17115 [Rhodococcus rhodnii]|uniref:Uncharacterized protein n=2 Tax=Rhodococcus rhodnii TaxID=38312 RepID=R7WIW0_9NOCA|nr:hypothetical protein [Rhodococcus rhodnii]EOM75171.1 hypothetical protein Rrhod_3505 [Rhodococcus rhodnii LMG 5362]TXG91602.1 hypothetical protein DW322_17115 [Rhodococcus rhodnii]